VIEAHRTVMAYEAARNYRHERRCHENELSEAFRQLCDAGERLSRDDYLAARRGMAIAKQEFDRLFVGYDAWVAPSALGEAPPAASGTGDPIMSRLWTALHAPCIALPLGRGPRDLPLGLQLVAPQGHDARLLDVAIWVEDRTRLSSN
jgi:Asp-tRNA(Asn)/Glu-tRNA(Gln) amidotransferase A subunit family amidase